MGFGGAESGGWGGAQERVRCHRPGRGKGPGGLVYCFGVEAAKLGAGIKKWFRREAWVLVGVNWELFGRDTQHIW